ncbi:MAG: thioesterase [Micrococcales bacterium]|nr:MAG: thioesterase [Micrococcales bacterium]
MWRIYLTCRSTTVRTTSGWVRTRFRVSYDILGLIPALPTTVEVCTVRPGRTIELVEAAAVVDGRPVVRARAWWLADNDTSMVTGGLPPAMPDRAGCRSWSPSQLWPGGYIRSIELVYRPEESAERGQAWIRTRLGVVADEPVAPVAGYLLLVDTANGMNTRVHPQEWAFPNVDLTAHLYREPVGGPGRWVGFDTLVSIGGSGVGLTSTVLHDEQGPVGMCEQILTVRPLG